MAPLTSSSFPDTACQLDNIGPSSAVPDMPTPSVPTLQDLADKISLYSETVQLEGLPMLSKAATLAQIAQAQALERIANAAEEIAAQLKEWTIEDEHGCHALEVQQRQP